MFPILLVVALLQGAQAAPPDTEIFLATMSIRGTGIEIGRPVNITSNPGYDNQPSFTPDGLSVLFTSVRGGGKQSDIYRYDVTSRQIVRVTDTPESEYSPAVTPDGRHISVVRVEADSTQRLWQFTLDGRDPQLVLPDIKPVGYYAWADDHTLALFVLGSPATLQVADTKTGKAETAAKDIGRSLQRMPRTKGSGSAAANPRLPEAATISFVQREPSTTKDAPAPLQFSELNPQTRAVTPLVRAVSGAKEADCAWTPDGTLLMAFGDRLYGWRRGEKEWRQIANLAALGMSGVTRIAVSPGGDRIALVAVDRRP